MARGIQSVLLPSNLVNIAYTICTPHSNPGWLRKSCSIQNYTIMYLQFNWRTWCASYRTETCTILLAWYEAISFWYVKNKRDCMASYRISYCFIMKKTQLIFDFLLLCGHNIPMHYPGICFLKYCYLKAVRWRVYRVAFRLTVYMYVKPNWNYKTQSKITNDSFILV